MTYNVGRRTDILSEEFIARENNMPTANERTNTIAESIFAGAIYVSTLALEIFDFTFDVTGDFIEFAINDIIDVIYGEDNL